ncbi:MAG: MFS transporter [Arenicella sp.]|jgi:MFS family permease|nr:MFS transporter [Arenicella sp.]
MSKFSQIDITELKMFWRTLLLSLFGIALSINAILLYSFGTLVVPFEEAFAWSRSAQQISITFLYGGAIVGLQLVGWMNARHGVKTVNIVSLFIMALGYLACTQFIGGSIWTLYIAFTILPIVGMGALAVTWTQLVSLWFSKNRGLALAIALSGSGVSATFAPGLMAWGIQNYGWQAPFVFLALLNFLLIPLSLLWFKLPSQAAAADMHSEAEKKAFEESQQGIEFSLAIKTKNYWLCGISLSLIVSAIVGVVTNTIPILQDRGFSAVEAGAIFSFFGVSLIIGRMVVGFLLDRFWPPIVAAASMVLPAIGCLIFLTGTDDALALSASAALFGLGTGAEFDIAAFLVARYFGLKDYSRLFGFQQAIITVAVAVSPLLFALMYNLTGGYTVLLVYCAVCTIVGCLLLLFLREPEGNGVQA